MNWGATGWLIIAVIIGAAVVAIAPAARAAERYLQPGSVPGQRSATWEGA